MVAGNFGRRRHPLGLRAHGTHLGPAGRRRGPRSGRLRSIRSTITVLLIIPMLSLVGLWLYAASGTVGGATAERDATTINNDVGSGLQGLIAQLTTERTDAFIWQSADG